MISNVKENSATYSSMVYENTRFGINYIAYKYCREVLGWTGKKGARSVDMANLLQLILRITAGASLALSLIIKEDFWAYVLMALGIIFLPANSQLYSVLYLFPALLIFYGTMDERGRAVNGVIIAYALIILQPVQYGILVQGLPLNNQLAMVLISIIALAACVVYAAISVVKDYAPAIRAKLKAPERPAVG